MPVSLQCSCGELYNLPDELIGRTVRCKGCRGTFKVPSPHSPQTGQQPVTGTRQHPNSPQVQQPHQVPVPQQGVPQQNYPSQSAPFPPTGVPMQGGFDPQVSGPNPHQFSSAVGSNDPLIAASRPYQKNGRDNKNGLSRELYWIIGGSSGVLVCIIAGLLFAFSGRKNDEVGDNSERVASVTEQTDHQNTNSSDIRPKRSMDSSASPSKPIVKQETNQPKIVQQRPSPRVNSSVSSNAGKRPNKPTIKPPAEKNVTPLSWKHSESERGGVGLSQDSKKFGKLEAPFNGVELAISANENALVSWGDQSKIEFLRKNSEPFVIDTPTPINCSLSEDGKFIAALAEYECNIIRSDTRQKVCQFPFFANRCSIVRFGNDNEVHLANEQSWLTVDLYTGKTISKVDLKLDSQPTGMAFRANFAGLTVLQYSGNFCFADDMGNQEVKDFGVDGKHVQRLCDDGLHLIEMQKNDDNTTVFKLDLLSGKRLKIAELKKGAYNVPDANRDGSLVIVNTGALKEPDESGQFVVVNTESSSPKIVAKLPMGFNQGYKFMPQNNSFLEYSFPSFRMYTVEYDF